MLVWFAHFWCGFLRGHEYQIVTQLEHKLILLECRRCHQIAELLVYPPL